MIVNCDTIPHNKRYRLKSWLSPGRILVSLGKILKFSVSVVIPVVLNTHKLCRSRKCIWAHIPMHVIFDVLSMFSYLPYTGHLSPLGLQTKPKHRATLQISACSSPIPGDVHELRGEHFCTCHLQVLKKIPRAKNGMFWFS